ncbi:MAG: RNA polymerase sigma-70 factor [Bacteroidetes bacterium]|nr:RNA polymerase sigma-70 factor [Bacteroidota bacterium]
MNERVRLDNFIFEELKAGNTRAFDKIFNDHYPNLCRFAFSIVHDEDTAHSLVQQVFVKLWENRAVLDHIERLTPYLATMTRNHSLNFVKQKKRNIQFADIPADVQTGNTTEDQIDADTFEEQLIIALSLLPERCKMAFEYSRFENLANKEIALKMEISLKGVEALIGRALKSLRISLAEYLPSARKGRSQNPILFALFRIAKATLTGFKESRRII